MATGLHSQHYMNVCMLQGTQMVEDAICQVHDYNVCGPIVPVLVVIYLANITL